MRNLVWFCWSLTLLACLSVGCRSRTLPPGASTPVLETHSPIGPFKTQLVAVVTDDWNRFQATLRRYERSPGQAWQAVGSPIDAVIGREGYGWGRGIHGDGPPEGRHGPTKREGDGRSPAGVFEIGAAYGYEATQSGVSLPYVQATPELRCVDDPESSHYNRIVSIGNTSVDWKSAEHMRRRDDLYTIAIVVEHNTQQTEPGAGSCIFIHVWRAPHSGMTGCTAMPMQDLQRLAGWLRPNAAVLVALPRSEYDTLKRPWQLP